MTTDELREHVTCEVPDTALQRYIDDAEAEIDYRFGNTTSVTETFNPGELTAYIYPSRRVDSITEVKERVDGYERTLSESDYELTNSIRVDRLPTGDNPRNMWGDQVTITYAPVAKQAQRDRVIIDLVKLALAYDGVDSQKIGDYSMSLESYQAKREAILSALGGRWWA